MSHEIGTSSFDEFANDYEGLLRDPIRQRFASGSGFFYERKLTLMRRFFRRQGLNTAAMSWLDVGCGRGDLLSRGQNDFATVAGCDPSAEMLRFCDRFPAKLQPSPRQVPFSDQSFDVATMVCVLHHVLPADRESLVADVARVLKPGGWLCIIEHNTLNPLTRLIVSRSPVDVDAQLLSARESRRLVRSAGCTTEATEYFLYVPEAMFGAFGFLEAALVRLPFGGQYTVFGRRR